MQHDDVTMLMQHADVTMLMQHADVTQLAVQRPDHALSCIIAGDARRQRHAFKGMMSMVRLDEVIHGTACTMEHHLSTGQCCVSKFESGYRKTKAWLYLAANLDKYNVVFSSNGSANISRADKADLDAIAMKDRFETVATHRRDLSTGLYSTKRCTPFGSESDERDVHALQLKIFRGGSRSLLLTTTHLRCPECRPTNAVLFFLDTSTVTVGEHVYTCSEGELFFLSAMDFYPAHANGNFRVYV